MRSRQTLSRESGTPFALARRRPCDWLSKPPQSDRGLSVTWWKWRPASQQHPGELPRLRRSQRAVIARAAAVVTVAALAATGALACDSHAASAGQHSMGGGPGAPRETTSRAAPAGGLTPAQIRAAYGLPAITGLAGPGPLKNITGEGQTIVIVDSFGSPTIAKDLARFDSYFG